MASVGGSSIIRSSLYLFGFVLGVTLGSWFAFAIFLNDSTTIIFRRFTDSSSGYRRKLVEFTQIVSIDENQSNTVDLISVKIKNVEPIKILCVVTYISNNIKRLRAINDTYANKCSKTIYFSAAYKARGFDIIYIESDEVSGLAQDNYPYDKIRICCFKGGYGSWNFFGKMQKRIAADHGKGNYDWVIYLDDQTYLIYDNLQHFLSKFDSRYPIFVGNLHSTFFADSFLKEAGFVLSNKTFALLNKFMDNNCKGWWYPSATEYALTKCLKSIGVRQLNGIDAEKGGHRFLPKGPKQLFTQGSWSLKWQVVCVLKIVTF